MVKKAYTNTLTQNVKRTLLFFVIWIIPLDAFAAAFLIYNQDAKATGMGMAVVSSIDNASAVFYNPALLVDQKGFGFSAGDTVIWPEMRHEDPATGKRTYTRATSHHVPNGYAKFTTGDFSFGIGIYSPFGLSTEWPAGWPGRYLTTFAEIKTIYLNPVIAYRLSDRISVAGGVSYVTSSIKLKNAINMSSFGLPDGAATLSGDGEGVNYNLAATARLPKGYTISATYRSPTRIRYDGRANLSLPAPLSPSSTGASAALTLPFLAAVGIAKQMGGVTLEGDILYTGWSSMSSYRVTSDNGSANTFFYKNWFNTPSISFGANYRLNKLLEMRAGYMFDKSPVPRATLSPELPDSTRHICTAGFSLHKEGLKLHVGYQATFFNDVRSYSPALGGTYSSIAHLGFIGLSYNQ
jgi:long-chain fatty acid transport protein